MTNPIEKKTENKAQGRKNKQQENNGTKGLAMQTELTILCIVLHAKWV